MSTQHTPGPRETLAQLVRHMTGAPRQSEQLKQALRFARGALKSTLASDRELHGHISAINKAIAEGGRAAIAKAAEAA